jgi:hypothetical protein
MLMRLFSAALLVGWFAVAAVHAVAVEKHSGVVAEVSETQIAIDEMGPWLGPSTTPVRRVFEVTASTKIARVERSLAGEEGWRRGYVSEPADLSSVHVGDFVTVSVEPRGRRNVAVQVEALRAGPNALN